MRRERRLGSGGFARSETPGGEQQQAQEDDQTTCEGALRRKLSEYHPDPERSEHGIEEEKHGDLRGGNIFGPDCNQPRSQGNDEQSVQSDPSPPFGGEGRAVGGYEPISNEGRDHAADSEARHYIASRAANNSQTYGGAKSHA